MLDYGQVEVDAAADEYRVAVLVGAFGGRGIEDRGREQVGDRRQADGQLEVGNGP